MAWHYGTYSCGHEGRTNIGGPTKDREWKAERIFSSLCPECAEKKRKALREKENAEAAKKTAEMELPELSGSEKQVAWANTLRVSAVEFCSNGVRKLDEDTEFLVKNRAGNRVKIKKAVIFDTIDLIVKKHTDARYWIDNRALDKKELLVLFLEEYWEAKRGEIPKEVQEEIDSQKVTVCPESGAKKSGVVSICTGSTVSAKYVKDNDFMEIVKSLRFKWDGKNSVWVKQITEFTGSANDRAAEIGNKLLAAGFTVQFPDADVKNAAVAGDYVAECTNWVKWASGHGKLAVVWDGMDDQLYNAAKMLPGAKWGCGAMLVPVEFFREVQDFAENMGFSISGVARKKIREYLEKEHGFEGVSVATPKRSQKHAGEDLKKVLKSSGAIIQDLLDC